MFNHCKNMTELDSTYNKEKRRIAQDFEELNEQRFQCRQANQRRFELFLYLKHKMDYEQSSNEKMLSILDEFEQEVNHCLRQKEFELEQYQEDLKSFYKKQYDKIEQGESL